MRPAASFRIGNFGLLPELRLPDVQDNLEVRLLLLQRRLAEQNAPIQLEKAGRGRLRLSRSRPIVLQSDELTAQLPKSLSSGPDIPVVRADAVYSRPPSQLRESTVHGH